MHECFVLTITHMQCTRLVNSQAHCDDNQWNTPSIEKTKYKYFSSRIRWSAIAYKERIERKKQAYESWVILQ